MRQARRVVRENWIGVDLDGTLAFYLPGDMRRLGLTHIGAPIPAMQRKVKQWRAEGKIVKIFTARICDGEPEVVEVIEKWCLEHLGEVLPITNQKDYDCTAYYDDLAIQIIKNTGQRADGNLL